jgi:hypothetical protein
MQSMNKADRNRPARIYLSGVAGIALIAMFGIAPAHSATPCPTVITACGCVITQPKIYTVANNLNGVAGQSICIEIAAARSILNLEGMRVIGNNAGTGIRIDQGADHVIVEGGNEADNDPPQNPSGDNLAAPTPRREAVVSQWNIGIEDDADNAIIQLFDAIGGVPVLPSGHTPGNVTAGVVLNHVNRSLVGDLIASYNGKFGVLINNSSNVHIANINTGQNGDTGLKLLASDHNRIGPASSPGNEKLGTWLFDSADNTMHDSVSSGNMNTGIVVGCGLDKKNCPGYQQSNHNRILVISGAPGNKVAGIVIRKHSGGNLVTLTHNEGNGGKKMDMVDDNNKCDSNTWYNNTGARNQACIH